LKAKVFGDVPPERLYDGHGDDGMIEEDKGTFNGYVSLNCELMARTQCL
jgi:hypothetical protein